MIDQGHYSREESSEEDKDFFDKYSATGESEWSRGSTIPFDDEKVLIERHFSVGSDEWQSSENDSRQLHRKDDWIKEDVRQALLAQAEIDATEIETEVQDGVVTLTGKVLNRLSKKIAEKTAEKCLGVIEVRNDLKLGLLSRGLFTH